MERTKLFSCPRIFIVDTGCSGCHLIIKCLQSDLHGHRELAQLYKSTVVTYGPERNGIDMIRQFPWQN